MYVNGVTVEPNADLTQRNRTKFTGIWNEHSRICMSTKITIKKKRHSFNEWVNSFLNNEQNGGQHELEEKFSALSTSDSTSFFHWFSYTIKPHFARRVTRPLSLRSVLFLILFIYFKCTVMCMWISYIQVYSIGLYIQSDSTLSHFSPHTDELTRLLNMEIDQCIHLAV